MMQSFRERIPELGTLKAMGFSDGQVLNMILAEAIVTNVSVARPWGSSSQE